MKYLKLTIAFIVANLFVGFVFGYDNFIIHPKLSSVAIEVYKKVYPDKLTGKKESWIVSGAIAEDADPRYINHFYDPTTGKGLGVPASVSVKEWARYQDGASAITGDYSESAILSNYRNGNFERAYQGVGHMLHLTQDMSVPAHTRLDSHPEGDPYEAWAAKNGAISASGILLTSINELNQAFDDLAKYSHANFFSKDTIIVEDSFQRKGGYILCGDKNVLFKCAKEIIEPQKTSYYIDDAVSSDYWNLLSPEAISYSAGVIEYFQNKFDAIDAEKKVEQKLSIFQKTLNVFSGASQATKYVFGDVVIVGQTRIIIAKEVASQGLNAVAPVLAFIGDPGQFVFDTVSGRIPLVILAIASTPTGDNPASVILATTPNLQGGPSSVVQPAQPSASNSSSAKKSPPANSVTQKTVSVPVFVKVPPQETTDPADSEQSSSPKLVFVGMQNVPMSFGGGFAPEVLAVTDVEESVTESPMATPSEPAVVPDGIVFATTSAPVYAVNPVVFSGEYRNSDSTFDTINIELKNTLLENATTSVAFSAQATTTGAVLSFRKEVDITDSGLFEYRARLENAALASSTPWSTSNFFTVNFATTTASSTPAVATTTHALVFETPNSANVLYSDLNQNGIADSEEDDVVASSSAWLAAGEYVFNNLIVTNRATITAAGNENSSSTFKGVKIFAKNLTIETGATISADGQGYKTGPGYTLPAGLASDPSASYGGSGGGTPRYYGSAIRPTDLGSGKGSRGGGAIQIVVTNVFTNNGKISVNGVSTGTSGGSIYVNTNSFAGVGSFSSNGTGVNWPTGIGGGGGRIALHYAQSSFSGSAGAIGGMGSWGRGGEGTIGFFDTINNDAYLKNTFRFEKSDEPFNFSNVYISNGAWVGVDEGATLTAENIFVDGAAHLSLANNVVLRSQSILVSGRSFITLGSGVTLSVPEIAIGYKSNLSLLSEDSLVANSLVLKDGGTLTSGIKKAVFIDVSNLEVATSSAISAWVSAVESDPDDFFSSGDGASVYIKSSGKLIIDGSISANAPEGKVGGGIYIDTSNLVGKGTIVSQGGLMVWGGYYVGYKGPFAGGNIAVYYATSSFAGTATAPGACGSYDGWSKTCAGNGKVIVDNISNKPAIPIPPAPVILSSEKVITAFDFLIASSTTSGAIDETAHTISVVVPSGADLLTLVPIVIVSPLATSSPASGVAQDFTMPVEYVVIAEDGTTQAYIVTVTTESTPIPLVVASSGRAIVAFDILVASSTIPGVVDEIAHTISLTVPFGTDVSALVPTIVVSALATSSPASLAAQDFTSPVVYTVTAEDGLTQVYVVSIVVEAPPAALLPTISSYTFNGIAGDISVDFATTTPTIELSLVSSKDVDWVSITIEDQTDTTKYKRFYSGAGCTDGTAVCAKTWDGILSSGEVAPNGVYRIKVHIKDTDGNDYNDYLLPYVLTINREAI